LSDSNQIRGFATGFLKSAQYQMLRKSFQWGVALIQAKGWTDEYREDGGT